ncbi:MAG: TspO/MBR family protein [Pseudomonadota bacterium]
MAKLATRIAFLALVLGGGILIGTLTGPGEWYANLNKPSFNPPGWVFGPVWTVLYILIAMVGWRLIEADQVSAGLSLWWGQLALNFMWSPAFFVLQQPWLALVIIVALLGVILALIRTLWSADRLSAIALVPYLSWVGFASVLNLSIAMLN